MGERKLLVAVETFDPFAPDMCEPGDDDIVAHLQSRSDAEAVALLRALLRARPDAAVAAVDTAKVARAWSDQGENEIRSPLGGGAHTAFAGPLGHRGPFRQGEWVFGRPSGWGPAPDRAAAKRESDAAWSADGWVLAGVPRG